MDGMNANDLRDYGRALEEAALFDLSSHGLLSCTGKDAGQFLHNLCTNEVVKLPVGRASEAFLTTAQAKVVDHVWILNVGGSEPTFYVDVGENEGPRIYKHLDRFLISEQLELLDLTAQCGHFHLVGPHACRLLSKAADRDLSSLQELEATEVVRGDHRLRVWRRNRLGVIGFDLLCAISEAGEWLRILGAPDTVSTASGAYDWLRIEAGLPRFGVDITESNLPQEIGRIEQTISYIKGCYIGQETVARVRSFGHVNRTLHGLLLTENTVANPGTKLFHENEEVGAITSCTISPRLNRTIALAYVRRGHDAVDTMLTLGAAKSSQGAVVSNLPFLAFIQNVA
ncbi:MAG TPA: glycine cleavage T C-terminal barrel domain-containing protein [Gemmataceae bacterium]|nr:glycine cleavage T C-terminal barrel domain-containing protein [Gemmataceae bacterium]